MRAYIVVCVDMDGCPFGGVFTDPDDRADFMDYQFTFQTVDEYAYYSVDDNGTVLHEYTARGNPDDPNDYHHLSDSAVRSAIAEYLERAAQPV